jgi:hypothetical protein
MFADGGFITVKLKPDLWMRKRRAGNPCEGDFWAKISAHCIDSNYCFTHVFSQLSGLLWHPPEIEPIT